MVANGRMPTIAESTQSVRSERRKSALPASRPTPASVKRIPAPKNGAMSSRPTAMTTHVLDQTSTQAA